MSRQKYECIRAKEMIFIILVQCLINVLFLNGKSAAETISKVCTSAKSTEILDLQQLQARWLLKI